MEPGRYGPFSYKPINRRPKVVWPDGNHIALWIVPNIETFPLNEPIPGGTGITPDVINWASRDYGARVGIFRIMEVMDRHGIRGTVALNSEVCDDYPEIIDDAMDRNWEFMGHNQSNSRYIHTMEDQLGRQLVSETLDRIEQSTGIRPKGWLSSGLQQNWTTLDALIDCGVKYVADFINDDQPYLMNVNSRQICSIPYSTEINDLPQFLRMNRTSEEFTQMIRHQFDTLYRESLESGSGRVMAICLHPFVIGVPHRIQALEDALSYISRHDGVWKTTGTEIIEHYLMGETF
ncbi:MAG: hypothetical protein CFH41_02522 [Alphaproteobacteria bacterium MarineAlpha11_Bin1]|nr:MAG: hypothetical protein CFH41_02522 [Alphaproteobacteria bacterium MarineAlpha11_Bin1]|tara:strand:- start:15112 stop:15984 length:873 start_codon:yes stop_codon:yes gene_type:complete